MVFAELRFSFRREKGAKMAVKRITVHCLEIEDRPGSLQKLLADAANSDAAGKTLKG
jgi:hypothetical protein